MIGEINLQQALANHTRAVWIDNLQVGSGATATSIPLKLKNPAAGTPKFSANVQADLVGAVAHFLTGANQGAFVGITAAAASSITVEALSAAPAQYDQLVILKGVTAQVSAAENLQQWAGTAVAAPLDDNSDGVAAATSGIPRFLARLTAWTGTAWSRLKLAASGSLQTKDDATGATGAAVPTVATMVGGSDGTDLRALKTDTDGTAQENLTKVGGTALTGADWTLLFQGMAKDGTDGTGITPPTGAVGIRGWLSGIYNTLLTAGIKVATLPSVVLAAGSAIIGKVGIDQTSPGTTNGVSIQQVGGTTQTGADWTPLLQGAATKQSTLTDRSGSITTGGTAQQLAAANTSRRYLLIQNPLSATTQGITTAESLFINFTTTAIAGEPSIELGVGQGIVMENGFISTEVISVIAATTGHKFTAKEG